MLIKLFDLALSGLIGKLPPEKKKALRGFVIELVSESIKGGAEGVSKGTVSALRGKHGI